MSVAPDIFENWKTWCRVNLHRGVRPEALELELIKGGLSKDQIVDALGPARGAQSAPIDHEAIANCALTKRVHETRGLKKLVNRKAQVFFWENFLPDADCDRTIQLIDGYLRPSTVTNDLGDKYVRTSSTCDLSEIDDTYVFELDILMSKALGIHWSYSEPIQGQKYEVGQEFKSHTDYFEPKTAEFLPNTEERGQRTWTFMIYLNDTPEGGATRFPRLEKQFKPKKGMAVIWNNLNPDGSVNPWTLHHGTKPKRGEKYIITKWFREKGWGPMFVD